MTPKQSEIFVVVETWWETKGYSPSIDEIMYIIGSKSRSNTSRIIRDLCEMGALKKMPNRRRTLRPSYVRFRNIV
jgi:SOS-response transcriptional repressor LexA